MVTLSLNVASPVTPSVPPTVVFLRSASSVTVSLPSTFVPFSVVSPVTESVLSMVTSPLSCEAFSTLREPAFTAPVVVISPAPASTPLPVSLPSAVISPFAFTLPRLSTVTFFSIVVSLVASLRAIPAVRLSVATMASLLAWMLSALVLILPSSSLSLFVRAVSSAVIASAFFFAWSSSTFRFSETLFVPLFLIYLPSASTVPMRSERAISAASRSAFSLLIAVVFSLIFPSSLASSSFLAVSSAVTFSFSSVFAFVIAASRFVTSDAITSPIALFLSVTSPLMAVSRAFFSSFTAVLMAAFVWACV